MEIWIYLLIGFVVLDIVIVIFVFLKRKKRGLSAADKEKYENLWFDIKMNPDYRHAIIDADKLLDALMTKRGSSGPLGEKLKNSESLFSDYNGIWRAHKLRNRIAHELNAKVTNEEAKEALKQFKRAYKDLGLL
jgi:hypothetical protein